MADEPAAPDTTSDDPPVAPDVTEPAAPEVKDDGALKSARKEAAEYRKRAAAAEARLKELDDAGKTEVERLTTRVQELEGTTGTADETIRGLRLQLAVANTAAEVGVRDTETALALIDKTQIGWDDDGNIDPRTVTKALSDLVARKPFLAAGRSIDAGAGAAGSPGTGGGMNELIRAARK
jgi:hypothetical protein